MDVEKHECEIKLQGCINFTLKTIFPVLNKTKKTKYHGKSNHLYVCVSFYSLKTCLYPGWDNRIRLKRIEENILLCELGETGNYKEMRNR